MSHGDGWSPFPRQKTKHHEHHQNKVSRGFLNAPPAACRAVKKNGVGPCFLLTIFRPQKNHVTENNLKFSVASATVLLKNRELFLCEDRPSTRPTGRGLAYSLHGRFAVPSVRVR